MTAAHAFCAFYDWVAQASAWWWPRFADHLWQTTLFAFVILAAAFVLKRGPARWRHAFCLIAAAKFLVPGVLLVLLAQQIGLDSLSFFRANQETPQTALLVYGITEPAAAFAATYEVTVVASSADRHQGVYLALTAIWLTGTIAILLLWGIRRSRFLRALRRGRNVRSGREWLALERARGSLHWQNEIGLVISPLKIEPAVWRVWRPTVVLPESIAGHLDDDELEAIMLHELVHIQRRDNLIGNLQLALCALLWFHPLVWFISRKLFDEREQACDEKVLEICLVPEAYASSILKVVRFSFGWRVAGVTGAASGSNLRRRIENIMSTGNTKRRTGRGSRLLASTLVGLALLILVAAGIYTRPRTVNDSAKDTATKVADNNEDLALATDVVAEQEPSKKTDQPPPAPPASPAPPAEPADAPAPPTPAQPVQPAQPPQPAQPAQEPQPAQPPQPPTPPVPPVPETPYSEKADKDKPLKEKSTEKSKEKIKKGALIEAPRPAYPQEIKKQKVEGIVSVVITIGDDGKVVNAKADSGPRELYAVSEDAALKARFQPTLVDGKPAKVTGVMTYNFKLDNPPASP